jgi:cytochrome c oxidase assembly factor 6
MGFLGFGSSTTSSAPATSGIAPNRSQRALCWEARDNFFECLNRHNIIDSITDSAEAKAKCGPQEVAFEKDCVGSWVRVKKHLGWTGRG